MLALDLIFLVDGSLSESKVMMYLLECGDLLLDDPGVRNNVGHGWAGCGVELKHAGDQVAEGLREEVEAALLVLRMRLPEEVCTIRTQETVEGV